MENNFLYNQFSVRKDEIQNNVIRLINQKNKVTGDELKTKLDSLKNQDKLKIAFVGQHNAGKSSIISALTGNKQIKISNNVETDIATDYEWNDVLLTDTPGLYAGMKEEHDILSLQKIKESDLLIFCITSSLFDDLLIKNFANLAYNQAYKSKIFLVVNKMSQEVGEYEDLVKNYKTSLETSIKTENGQLEDFNVSFIDANDYMEGVDTNDEDFIECSHFQDFVESLNTYISEKKFFAKLDTPCRVLEGAIDNEIINTSTELDKNKQAVLTQMERSIESNKKELNRCITDIKFELRNSIIKKAGNVIEKIGVEKVEENVFDNINEEIVKISQKSIDDLQSKINEVQSNMFEELGQIVNSKMTNYVLEDISNKDIEISLPNNKDFSNYINKYKAVSEFVSKGGEKVASLAGNAANFGAKLTSASGSQLHTIVLNVGHFFGKSFKPWEAVNMAGKIGKFAKGLGPALSAISFIVDIGSKVKNEKDIQKIQDAKIKTFSQFSDICDELTNQIEAQYSICEKELFNSELKEIQDLRNNMIKDNECNNSYVNSLKSEKNNINKLISDISEA